MAGEIGHLRLSRGYSSRVAFPASRRSTLSGTVSWIPPSSPVSRPACSGELSEFLRIPSVSALPAHAADCRRAAEWLRDELTRLGCPDGDSSSRGTGIRWSGPRARTVPGRPDAADLRPLRRAAARSARGVGQPAVRADRPRRPALRPRRRRRQGPGVLPAQGLRGGAGRRAAAAAQRALHLRGRGGVRRAGHLRSAARASPSAPGPMRCWCATCRTTRPACPRCTPRFAGTLLRRDLGPHAASAICTPAPTAASRRTRSRRWSASWPSSRTPTARSGSPSSTRPSSRPPRRAQDLEAAARSTRQAFLRDEVTAQGAHRAQGVLGVRARLGAADLRDPRHPGRLRRRGGQDGDSRPGDGQGEPAAGAGAGVRRRSATAARARGGEAGAPVGRGEGHPAPRRRSGAGGRRPSRRSTCSTRRSRRSPGGRRCRCGPAGRSRSSPSSGSPARRCSSPASACRTMGSTPPTKNSTSLSSGAGSRSSGGSSSCSPRRARRGDALLPPPPVSIRLTGPE